jgi:glutamate carboxypeptidase
MAPVLEGVPAELDGVRIDARMIRSWPGMDTGAVAAPLLEDAASALGRPIVAAERGGASDASHMATTIPLSVDGLGPRGGGAHAPHEWVSAESLRTRAEVALAVVAALLGVGAG